MQMKIPVLFSVLCGLSLMFLAGCGQKPAPLQQGTIWKVVWSPEPNSKTGLYREKMPARPEPTGGEYSVDMYGTLYPNVLILRRLGSPDSHVQIIPMSQIVRLEFGDGGIKAVTQ